MTFTRQTFFVKMSGILVLVLLLLGLTSIFQTRFMMHSLFSEQQEKRGISIAGMLATRAANLIMVHNYYDLHELVKDTQAHTDDVRYVFIVSNEGELLAHSFSDGFPRDLLTANIPLSNEQYHIAELSTEEGIIRDIAMPIFDGRLGIVRVGLNDYGLREILGWITRQLLLDAFVVGLFGIGLTLFLTGRLTRPIRELVRVAGAITDGDFSKRAKVSTHDEFYQLAATFNSMADHLDRLLTELKQKEEARSHLLQKVIVAQEDERKRIARELHDETGQTLTSLMMGLKYLAENCPGKHEECQLEEMRQGVKETLNEIHRLSVELRPSILDDMGLVAALEKYVADYRDNYQLDVDMHVNWQSEGRTLREVEVTIYRIVQEALTNIAKYAQAQNVSIILTCSERGIEAIVEDDGRGFDADMLMQENASGNKLGLYGMRERATLVGGTVTIEASPGLGTTIYVRIPTAGR